MSHLFQKMTAKEHKSELDDAAQEGIPPTKAQSHPQIGTEEPLLKPPRAKQEAKNPEPQYAEHELVRKFPPKRKAETSKDLAVRGT
jgi:hypothetical protein